jgi:hypothetical protein
MPATRHQLQFFKPMRHWAQMRRAQPVTDAPIIVPIESMSCERCGAVAYFVVGTRDLEKPDIPMPNVCSSPGASR